MAEINHGVIKSKEILIPNIQIIKAEPDFEIADKNIQGNAPISIRVKSLSSLQAESSIKEQTVAIKQEPSTVDDEISKELAEIEKDLDSTKLAEQLSGDDTDDFTNSKNDPYRTIIKHEKTESHATKNDDPEIHKKSKKRRSSSISSSSLLHERSRHKSKKKYKSSSLIESDYRRSTRDHERRIRRRSRSKKDRRKVKKYDRKRGRERSRSRDKYSKSLSRSTSFEDNKRPRKSKLLNIKDPTDSVLEYNNSAMQQIGNNIINSEVAKDPQPITSNSSNQEYSTNFRNLRPLIVKTELKVLPKKSNTIQIKQELLNEKFDNDEDNYDDDDDDDVEPPLPIMTSVKVERNNENLSTKQIKLENSQKLEDILNKAVENCIKALEQFNNFKNNPYAGPFYYTPSKHIQPPSENTEYKSPLLKSKQVYLTYSRSVTAKVANLIGFDISQHFDKLSECEYKGILLESGKKLLPDNPVVTADACVIQSVSTQTDMIPCIECVYRNLQKPSSDETKEYKSICVGTYPEIPIIKSIRTANANQLLSLNDFFELLMTPQSNEAFDRIRLRDRLLEIYDKGQKPLLNSESTVLQQPRILEPTPGILPNMSNNYVMHPNQQAIHYVNNGNYAQSSQPYTAMQLGYQLPQDQQHVNMYFNSTNSTQQLLQQPLQPMQQNFQPHQQPFQPPLQQPAITPLVISEVIHQTLPVNKNDPRIKQKDQNDLLRSSTLNDLYEDENSNRQSYTRERGRGKGKGRRGLKKK